MGFNLEAFDNLRLDAEYLEWLVDVHSADIQRHFCRLWDYYTNPTVDVSGTSAVDRKVNASGRPYVQAQEIAGSAIPQVEMIPSAINSA